MRSSVVAWMVFGSTWVATGAAAQSESEGTPEFVLEQVVVTAQRRAENLQRAAIAVSAVSSEALTRGGVRDAQELSKFVPALTIASSGGAGTQVSIRGVGNFAGNAYAEQAVAVNLDGVYLSRPAAFGGLFFDLDRVEVLKGPQGTLYGRNATAGAVNIVTRKPEDELTGEATLDVGNYDLRGTAGVLNVPLGSSTAIRAAFQTTQRDGYLTDGYGDEDSTAGRLSIKAEPGADLSLLLTADYFKQGGQGQAGVFTPFVNANDPYTGPSTPASNTVFAALPPFVPRIQSDGFLDNRYWGIGATLDWSTDPGTLTVIPAYREVDLNYLHYAAGFPVSDQETSRQRSLEARFVSSDARRMRWVIGAYGFQEDIDFALLANQGVTSSYTVVPELQSQTAAVFGQTTFDVTDTVRLVGGLRYTRDSKEQEGSRTSPLPAGAPAAIVCPAPARIDGGNCIAPVAGDAAWNKVTWKAGIEVDVSPGSLAYFNVATGYRAGGFYSSLPPNSFEPETLLSYTLGSKNRWLADSLQFNVEAYYWKYDDKQTTHLGPITPTGFELITENAGNATLYGVDTETTWLASGADLFTLQLQYQRSKYDDFVYNQYSGPEVGGVPVTNCATTTVGSNTRVDCSGRSLPLAPTWSGTFAYQHTFSLSSGARVIAGLDTRFESEKWLANEYVAGEYQDAWHRSNATLTYDTGVHWSVTGYVRNIEDEAVKTSAFVQPVLGVPVVTLLPPRTYGVQLNAKF